MMTSDRVKRRSLGSTRRRSGHAGRKAATVGTVVILLIIAAVRFETGTAHATVPLPELLTEIQLHPEGGWDAGYFYPHGFGTNPVNGHVYVGDNNARISEFTAWGTFVKTWGWGVADGTSNELQTCTVACSTGLRGSGVGEFGDAVMGGVAVDSSGDVYAVDRRNHRVEKFNAAGEFLLMFGGEVDKTTKANVCTKADVEGGDECGAGITGTGPGQFSEWPGVPASSWMTVGPGGTVYVGDRGRIEQFGSDGVYKGELPDPTKLLAGEPVQAIAVDSSGDVYVVIGASVVTNHTTTRHLYKISPAGVRLETLEVANPTALATDSTGDLYVLAQRVFESATDEVDEVREFGPNGQPLVPGGSHFAVQPGEELAALGTNTVGDVLVAGYGETFTDEISVVSVYGPPPVSLEPPPPVAPEVTVEYAASVDPEDGVVRAQINPFFWPDAKYYVQYGLGDCAEGGCVDQPVAPGALLTAKSVNVPVTTADVHLTGLLPDTTYHYRFVAQSGGGGPVPVYGPDRTFTTFPAPVAPDQACGNAAFRIGPSASLVDCRAYEMVSPVDKNGGDAKALPSIVGGATASLDQGSLSGEKLTYSAYRAFGDAQSAPYSVQYVASRQQGSGWSSHAISPPRDLTVQAGSTLTFADTPYKGFSPDLSQAWLLQDTDPVLAQGGIPGYVSLYRQDNSTEGYEAVSTVQPPHASAAAFIPEFQGSSADGRRAIFRAEDNLTPEAPVLPLDGTGAQLYESVSGQLHLVSILPDGTPNKMGSTAGTGSQLNDGRSSLVEHAISIDGSRIFWTAELFPGTGGRVYVRENPEQQQSAIEEGECVEPAKACTVAVSQSVSAARARFWLASADGSKVLFSFVEGSHAGDLYEFDVDTGQPVLIAHKVMGVVGASEDASYVYFVSEEAIAGTSGATEGQPNLYLRRGETTDYIATLSKGDRMSSFAPIPVERYARVTPDGRHVVFVSKGSLTGYENLDASSGQADVEVYRYDAENKQLNCMSCNRTGARPAGRAFANNAWVAGLVPAWENQLYQARYVSDDGARVFFESFDGLVPQDNNGKEDVYEWEAPGTGECAQQAVSYSPPNGGCVSLISTGESSQDSEFVDAGPSGDDVFVRTISSLVPQDTGLYDIYDARVNGGFQSPVSASECEGEACQNPALPPIFTTPASVSFNGTGNLISSLPAAVAPRSRPLTRAQKLALALKACKSKPVRRRAKCRAQAHKRYPPTTTRSQSAKRNGSSTTTRSGK